MQNLIKIIVKSVQLKILLCLDFTAQAMDKIPNDIFYDYMIPYLIPSDHTYEQPLVKWSELSKNYTQQECYKSGAEYLNTYIKIIDNLSSYSWFVSYLPKDLISLSLTNKRFYFLMYNRYKRDAEYHRKSQICLCLEELQVYRQQEGIIQPAFGYIIDKKLCKKECTDIQDNIMIEYYLHYGYNQKKQDFDIRILLAFTFGHGKCQHNEFYTDETKNGYTFSCKKFGNFLRTIAEKSFENDYMTKIVFSLAFYIEQQKNLPVKIPTYRTFDQKVNLFNYAKYHSVKYNDENRVIVARHCTYTGQRFIIVPFNVSIENKQILRFFQLIPMYYAWDMVSHQTHRILEIFPEPYPDIPKENRYVNNMLKIISLLTEITLSNNPKLIKDNLQSIILFKKEITLYKKTRESQNKTRELKNKIRESHKKIRIMFLLTSFGLLFSNFKTCSKVLLLKIGYTFLAIITDGAKLVRGL